MFEEPEPLQPGEYDAIAFDQQYLRYMQILDTDYDNYASVYSCVESAEYRDSNTGKYLTDEQAWAFATKGETKPGSYS